MFDVYLMNTDKIVTVDYDGNRVFEEASGDSKSNGLLHLRYNNFVYTVGIPTRGDTLPINPFGVKIIKSNEVIYLKYKEFVYSIAVKNYNLSVNGSSLKVIAFKLDLIQLFVYNDRIFATVDISQDKIKLKGYVHLVLHNDVVGFEKTVDKYRLNFKDYMVLKKLGVRDILF